jgi:hypothetical protein
MKPVGVVALAWLLVGCGGRVGGAASGAQATSDAAAASLDRGRTEDSGIPEVGPSDARSIDDQDSPFDFTRGPTVWVGQIDQNVSWPYDYDGGTVLFSIALEGGLVQTPNLGTGPQMTGPEKVVLILDAKANPLIGTISFGDVGAPPPATDPNQPYPVLVELPDGQPFDVVYPLAYLTPFTGFSYSLVSSTLSGNLLQLAFVPLQVFQSWCAIQDASMPYNKYGCICDGGACTPPSSPVRQLTLTVSGGTMQGQLLGLGAGPHDIRLQRAQ